MNVERSKAMATTMSWRCSRCSMATGSLPPEPGPPATDPGCGGVWPYLSTIATTPGAESCIVGVIDTTDTPEANVLARAVADRYAADFVCGSAQPRAFGHVGLDTPMPHRVAPRSDVPSGD